MRYAMKKLTASVIALAIAVPAFAQDAPTADTVVATVNGTNITLGHMVMVQAGLPEQYRSLPDEVLFDGILDQLINQTLLADSDDAAETLRVKIALDNERRALLAAEAAENFAQTAISDEALMAAYSEKYAGTSQGEEFNASHILLETEEDAKAVVEEVNGGADFAAVAREKSTGPSGPNGGALDWFGPGMMVPEFQAAVETLDVGEISAPVQTQFGWHVIKLNDKRTKPAPQLEEVRDQLTQELQQQAIQDHLTSMRETAQIERDLADDTAKAALRNMELLEK